MQSFRRTSTASSRPGTPGQIAYSATGRRRSLANRSRCLLPPERLQEEAQILARVRKRQARGAYGDGAGDQGWKTDRRFLDHFPRKGPKRPDHRGLEDRPRHYRPQAGGERVESSEGSCRGRQRGQEPVPRQHEPRVAHPHERNYGHDGPGPWRRTVADPPRLSADRPSNLPMACWNWSTKSSTFRGSRRAASNWNRRLSTSARPWSRSSRRSVFGPTRRAWNWSATWETCRHNSLAIPCGCGRCWSTWWATPSSSPPRARWS